LNDRGNYYVGLISPRIPGTLHLVELMAPHNLLRKFIARLIHMVLVPAKIINQVHIFFLFFLRFISYI
jgi:hypothetical protein